MSGRTSEIRLQVDRWPIEKNGEYVLTAIIVCTFDSAPSLRDIRETIIESALRNLVPEIKK